MSAIMDTESRKPGLEVTGFGECRMTKQRKVIYEVLTEDTRDHPTASEVFMRSKSRMPGISLATDYNCLETLTQAGLVKQVNVDREPSRFCPNLRPHAHFFCTGCQRVFDVDLRKLANSASPWAVPEGSTVDHIDVAMKGLCPECSAGKGALDKNLQSKQQKKI